MAEQQYVTVDTKEGLDGMRAKPAMYLGSTGVLMQGHAPRALTQMAQEVISNSLDEALAGHGDVVDVVINEDQSMSIIDQGRGVPKGPDKTFDAVIRSCTAPHTSGKFDDANYAGENTTGTHGIGLKATNAISKKLIVEATCASSTVNKSGEIVADGGFVQYYIEFEQATVLEAKEIKRWSKKEAETEEVKTGTKITFWPDDTILESIEWTLNDLEPRLEASAFLFPGVEVRLEDKRSGVEKSWKYENGLEDYISNMSKGESLLKSIKKPIVVDTLSEVDNYTFKVAAALVYSDDMNSIIETYANGVPTKEGGPHLDGFNAAILKAINDFATDKKLIKQNFRLSDVTEGLIAALHVQVPSKIFETEGQTKEKLATVQARTATYQSVYQALSNFFYDNLDAATEIVEKTEAARQAREAAAKSRKDSKASKDAKRSKKLEISSKLKQALSKDPKKKELIITEGDSASNAKRDKMTQAILGIRGKIRNVFELTLAEALSNEEVSTIIGSIGAGVGSECKPEDSNYGAGIYLACFDGETKVKSLDGKSYSFNELVESNTDELWVYSMDSNGRVVPALAKKIRKTGDRSKMVRVTLDNGEVIESTPEHLFMTVDGVYIEAQNLRSGQSLMPLYTKLDERGYELFYSQADGRYEFTHRMVAENVHSLERSLAEERLKNEEHHANHNSVQVHHKDENKLNNLPENLEYNTAKEHWNHHAKDGERITRYNQSEERLDHLKDLHKEGVYDQSYFGNNGYNGSDQHKNDIKNAHSRGVYKENYRKLSDYNRSDEHAKIVAKTNASEKHIDSVKRSKILMSVRFLIDHNMPVDEYHYEMYRNKSAMRFKNAIEYFGSIDLMIEEALKTEPREFEHARDFRFSYDSDRKQKNQIAKVVRKILDANEAVTEARYNSEKGSRTPRFDRAVEKFGSYENLIEYASNYNHKVVSVETIEYDDAKPVYCMTVDEHHNFFLDNGVLVKNCDADDDGAHITALLLTLIYKFMRNLIVAGHVYVIVPPLYKAERYVKGKPEIKMFFTEQELAAARPTLGGYDIIRYKGLGEMDKDTEAFDAITNRETRRVVQVTIEDAMRAAQMMKVLMGDDATLRSSWIETSIDFEEMAYS